MENVLNDQIIKQINEVFADLKEPVQVLYFGSRENCDYCDEARQLLEEVAATNDKIELSVYDLQENQDIAQKFNVTNAPGVVIAAKDGAEVRDLGIQFSGIPSGHEFGTLINDILLVSQARLGSERKDARVPEESRQAAAPAGVRHTHLSRIVRARCCLPTRWQWKTRR